MTQIHPCRGCPLRDGCERRDELRAKIKGIGARSVTFDCQKLRREMHKGRRIVIKAPFQEWNRDNEYRIVKRPVRATILFASGVSFVAAIDPFAGVEDRYRFRRYQPHHRIVRFLDEPDAPFCANGNILSEDGGCDRREGFGCVCAARMKAALLGNKVSDDIPF